MTETKRSERGIHMNSSYPNSVVKAKDIQYMYSTVGAMATVPLCYRKPDRQGVAHHQKPHFLLRYCPVVRECKVVDFANWQMRWQEPRLESWCWAQDRKEHRAALFTVVSGQCKWSGKNENTRAFESMSNLHKYDCE